MRSDSLHRSDREVHGAKPRPRDTIRAMSSLQAPAGLQPSASYSFTMRIELRQLPGAFAAVASAIGTEGAILGAIDLVRVDQRGVTRDVTVACVDAAHGERVVDAVRALDGMKVIERLRPHVPDAQGRQDRDHRARSRSRPATTSRWPTRRASRACRRAIARRPRVGLDADDQGQHRRGRLRRHRRARPGQHRPRGRDAGDGGQGDAVQGARRRRRLPAVPGHHRRRRDRRASSSSRARRSAASTSRTSPRRAASRSSGG